MPAEKEEFAMTGRHTLKGREMNGESIEVPWMALQEDNVSSVPPVLTRDGSYVFIVQDSSVLIVSRVTNRIVAKLSDTSLPVDQRHTAPITGMILSLSNPLQLITCSLDGTIKVWDYLESSLYDNVQVGHAIVGMSASAHWKNRLFIAVCKHANSVQQQQQPGPSSSDAKTKEKKEKEVSSTMYSVQLGRGVAKLHKPQKIVRLGKTRPVSHIVVSPDGRWLVVASHAKLHVLDLNDTGAGFTKFATESQITSLTFHPHTDVSRFATGEANGKIKIWHCLEQHTQQRDPLELHGAWEHVSLTTTLHWHAHAVAALQYTPDGAQLMSGGEESVLVLWKLLSGTAAGTDGREFVPRLGAPIVSLAIAVGYENTEQEYVARLADGSVVFIASLSLKPTRMFSTIKCDATPAQRGQIAKPLALDAAAGQLALLSGHPSTLQFIDVRTRAHIRDMEIVPSNRVSRPDEAVLTPPAVQHIAFSEPLRDALHAEWMATVDDRDAGIYSSELSLKLWQWEPRTKTYTLNTRIDHPHDKGVSSMSFSPRLATESNDDFFLVTTGGDGQVKTWRLAQRTLKGARTEQFWVCRSSFAYREGVPHDAAWSADGSLLAIAQGLFVTLWDPHTLVMQARLTTPELKEVKTCVFCGRSGRYLAATGAASRLVVWDLVSLCVVWTSPEVYSTQVPHGDGVLAIRSSGNSSLLDYICPSISPVLQQTYRVPFALQGSVINLSRSSGLSELYLFALRRHEHALMSLVGIGSAAVSAASRANVSLQSVEMNDARATLFDELFGVADVEQERVTQAMVSNAQQMQKVLATDASSTAIITELFAMPPHLLPPVSMLLDEFVDAVLPPRVTMPATCASEHSSERALSSAYSTESLVDEPPRLDAVDHVAQVRDADLGYLTAVFDKLMTASAAPPSLPTGRRPSSSSRKESRRASRTASS